MDYVVGHVWGNIFREGLQLDWKLSPRQVVSSFPLTDLAAESVKCNLVGLDQIIHQLATERKFLVGSFISIRPNMYFCCRFSC